LLSIFQAKAQEWIARLGRGELTIAISVERNAGGMAMPADSPLVRAATRLVGKPAKAKPTSTEAGIFARAGCEAIVIGPGRSTGNAHTANERIEMTQLTKATDLYESLIVELCGER
jgi:acetylornithine deacetylase/succinyl-diaminopimelate desuccinylase-like protein